MSTVIKHTSGAERFVSFDKILHLFGESFRDDALALDKQKLREIGQIPVQRTQRKPPIRSVTKIPSQTEHGEWAS